MTHKILSTDGPRRVPDITRTKGDPGDGHTAIIYFAHGEPETYYPIGWIHHFREFDEQHIRFVPLIARPFFFYKLRRAYKRVGGSTHHQMHTKMLNLLERKFREEGDTATRFYLSFLDDGPRLDTAVIRALNEGASKIVVSQVFLTRSSHTEKGTHLVDAIRAADYGATVTFTEPLWNSVTLQGMFVERAQKTIGMTDTSNVGVLLVGHGQPDEWDKLFPTQTEHETRFRMAIVKKFVEAGYPRDNVALAWMEFKRPKPAEVVEQLVDSGVGLILFFPASISAESIHSQYDIPRPVRHARVPEHVRFINLGAWNDDPIVISAIKEKIDAVL